MTMRLITLPFDAVNISCGVAVAGNQDRALVVTLSLLFMLFGFAIANILKRKDALQQAAQ